MSGVDLGTVQTRFANACARGEFPRVASSGPPERWWARSIRLDDDGVHYLVVDGDGALLHVPFVADGGKVSFRTPQLAGSAPIAAGRGFAAQCDSTFEVTISASGAPPAIVHLNAARTEEQASADLRQLFPGEARALHARRSAASGRGGRNEVVASQKPHLNPTVPRDRRPRVVHRFH